MGIDPATKMVTLLGLSDNLEASKQAEKRTGLKDTRSFDFSQFENAQEFAFWLKSYGLTKLEVHRLCDKLAELIDGKFVEPNK
jgi:hypothetical protein